MITVIPTFSEKLIWMLNVWEKCRLRLHSHVFLISCYYVIYVHTVSTSRDVCYHYHRQIFTVWSTQTPVTLIVQDNCIIVCIYSSYFNKLDFEQKFCITIPFKILINFNKSEASSTNCFYLFIYFTLLSGGIAVVWGRFVIVRGRVASYTLPQSHSLLQIIFYCLDQTPI